MGTTPIELLPAAGVGMYYDWYCYIEFTYGTIAYEFSVLDYIYVCNTLSGEGSLTDYNWLTATYNGIEIVKPEPIQSDGSANFKTGRLLNEGVVLTTWQQNNPTLGDGTLRVKIYHKTITFGA